MNKENIMLDELPRCIWEVQTLVGGEWENTWTEEIDGLTTLVVFASFQEALESFQEFLDDCTEAGIVCSDTEYRFVSREAIEH